MINYVSLEEPSVTKLGEEQKFFLSIYGVFDTQINS